ncbi:MAG TPA: serine protease [Xanthobacteraceae bacterium]|jgi:hypothetical protein
MFRAICSDLLIHQSASLLMMQRRLFAGFVLPTTGAVALLTLLLGLNEARAADHVVRGSGVVIGGHGEILTNSHVVKDCTHITVRPSSGDRFAAHLIASDGKNDLAAVSGSASLSAVAAFRDLTPVRAGEAVVAMGYPLSGLRATTANLSLGNVSALAGLYGDPRYLQISAPIQPENSGGPLLDSSGHLIGVVTATLNAPLIAAYTGEIPQKWSDRILSAADVGDIARAFTVQIECVSTGPSQQSATGGTSIPASSQQAILFDEDASDPRGKAYYGLTTWRTELLPSSAGQQEPAISAQITIPGRRMLASFTLRRNSDQSLAASHVIEISFNLPFGSPGGGISNVAGVLMKASLKTQGAPLAGLIEKVKNSSFLIDLSTIDPQMQQNLQLLKDRDWLDIAIVYNDGPRGILALQKGLSGQRVFADTFATWKQ